MDVVYRASRYWAIPHYKRFAVCFALRACRYIPPITVSYCNSFSFLQLFCGIIVQLSLGEINALSDDVYRLTISLTQAYLMSIKYIQWL